MSDPLPTIAAALASYIQATSAPNANASPSSGEQETDPFTKLLQTFLPILANASEAMNATAAVQPDAAVDMVPADATPSASAGNAPENDSLTHVLPSIVACVADTLGALNASDVPADASQREKETTAYGSDAEAQPKDAPKTHTTLIEFVDALRAMPSDSLVCAGADGIRFHARRFSPASVVADSTYKSFTETHVVGPHVSLSWEAVDRSSICKYNCIDLAGGPVPASALIGALSRFTASHGSACVTLDGGSVVLPIERPVCTIPIVPTIAETTINPFTLPHVRSLVDDAITAGCGGNFSPPTILSILERTLATEPRASMVLYAIDCTLVTPSQLHERYPLMDASVRDVVFVALPPVVLESRVTMHTTPLSAHMLDAAYGPDSARVEAARRLVAYEGSRIEDETANAAAAPYVAPKAPSTGVVHTDLSLKAIDDMADAGSPVLVMFSSEGCSFCGPALEQLTLASARLTIPVAVIERNDIPRERRPFGYPSIYITEPHTTCGSFGDYKGDRSADSLVEYVRSKLGDSAVKQ